MVDGGHVGVLHVHARHSVNVRTGLHHATPPVTRHMPHVTCHMSHSHAAHHTHHTLACCASHVMCCVSQPQRTSLACHMWHMLHGRTHPTYRMNKATSTAGRQVAGVHNAKPHQHKQPAGRTHRRRVMGMVGRSTSTSWSPLRSHRLAYLCTAYLCARMRDQQPENETASGFP